MSDLPRGWTIATVADLGEPKLGKMLDRAKNQGRAARYLRNINVRWFRFDLGDMHSISVTPEEMRQLAVHDGDLFICEGGEPGRCAVWHGGDNAFVYQKALHRFRSHGAMVPELLMYRLRLDAETGALSRSFTGTTIKHLTGESLARLEVPVPPLPEQKRIANKLGALFARVDACRQRLDRIPGIVKRFRHAVLAAATSGELTREWREERGIDGARASARLADLGELGRGKSKHRPRNDPRLYGGPYPFIQTGDVAQSGGRIERHTQTYSELGLAQSRLWPAGTVCITIAANIGDTSVLTYPACFPDSVVGFVADPARAIPEFVKWSIDVISDRLESFAPATAQKNINLAILNEIEIRCPGLEEQAEIVRRVQLLLESASTVTARLVAAKAVINRLTPSALAKAFRGELVPQDPSDEPASVLMERIRTHLASPAETSKPRRIGTTRSRSKVASHATHRPAPRKRRAS